MLLWFIVGVMLFATLTALLLPLHRGRDDIETREAYDANVFKDQLRAIDEELAQGLIDAAEADAARIEVSRKLLSAAAQAEKHPRLRASGRAQSRLAMYGLGAMVPVLALSLYFMLGSPGLRDLPLQARLQTAPEKQRLDELIARAEQKLAENPADGRGWEIMAPVYLKYGMYDKAIGAYRNVVRLLGPSGERLAGLVDAMVLANDGVVTEEALPLVKQAVEAGPDQPKPQFWLALYHEQNNRSDEAIKLYTQLLERSSSDQPWRVMVSERLNALRKEKGLPAAEIAGLPPVSMPESEAAPAEGGQPTAADRGPSAEDMRRAADMSAEDRQAMVNSMVSNLDERLRKEGGDVASWMKLINAYRQLGRTNDAETALKRARETFKNDTAAIAQLAQFAKQLGLDS